MISPEEWDRIDRRPPAPSLDLVTALLIFSAVFLILWWAG